MRCPKCSFISFDDLTTCAKCSNDLSALAQELQGTCTETSLPFFLSSVVQSPDLEDQTLSESQALPPIDDTDISFDDTAVGELSPPDEADSTLSDFDDSVEISQDDIALELGDIMPIDLDQLDEPGELGQDIEQVSQTLSGTGQLDETVVIEDVDLDLGEEMVDQSSEFDATEILSVDDLDENINFDVTGDFDESIDLDLSGDFEGLELDDTTISSSFEDESELNLDDTLSEKDNIPLEDELMSSLSDVSALDEGDQTEILDLDESLFEDLESEKEQVESDSELGFDLDESTGFEEEPGQDDSSDLSAELISDELSDSLKEDVNSGEAESLFEKEVSDATEEKDAADLVLDDTTASLITGGADAGAGNVDDDTLSDFDTLTMDDEIQQSLAADIKEVEEVAEEELLGVDDTVLEELEAEKNTGEQFGLDNAGDAFESEELMDFDFGETGAEPAVDDEGIINPDDTVSETDIVELEADIQEEAEGSLEEDPDSLSDELMATMDEELDLDFSELETTEEEGGSEISGEAGVVGEGSVDLEGEEGFDEGDSPAFGFEGIDVSDLISPKDGGDSSNSDLELEDVALMDDEEEDKEVNLDLHDEEDVPEIELIDEDDDEAPPDLP